MVELVDTADLKSAAYLHKGRTGSIPVPGTKLCTASAREAKAGAASHRKAVAIAHSPSPNVVILAQRESSTWPAIRALEDPVTATCGY